MIFDYHAVEQMKHKLVDHIGMELLSKLAYEGARDELQVALESILARDIQSQDDKEYADLLCQAVLDDLCGLGPLEPLLHDDDVTEIMVNGVSGLFYEKAGRICQVPQVFYTNDQIRVLIDRIIAPLGRRLDDSSPLVNARMSQGHRVNAVIEPISIDGPCLTIRKFHAKISRLDELVDQDALPAWLATWLRWMVKLRLNIAVVGGTGSGKTTLLNALSTAIPITERIITIEDSAELKFADHPHVVRLESRDASIEGTGAVSIRQLVVNALRMRPDRIIVGECRSEEAIDMLQAMNTGHDGSLTTLHAGSAQEALSRLVLMCRFGMDLDTKIIEEQIATALDLIIVVCRLPEGRRLVTGCYAVDFDRTQRTFQVHSLIERVGYGQDWQLCQRAFHLVDEADRRAVMNDEEVKQWLCDVRRYCTAPHCSLD